MSTTTIKQAMAMVSEFHDKVAGRRIEPLTSVMPPSLRNDTLSVAAELAAHASDMLDLFKIHNNANHLRSHLILEETAELHEALAYGDEERALDALADLLYVLLGTAVTLDLPLAEAFDEVHRSNMTKTKQADDPDNCRVRAKGNSYEKPRIREILDRYRNAVLLSVQAETANATDTCRDRNSEQGSEG